MGSKKKSSALMMAVACLALAACSKSLKNSGDAPTTAQCPSGKDCNKGPDNQDHVPLPGDCNDSGKISLGEIAYAIGIINYGVNLELCLPADVNGDDRVRSDDMTVIIVAKNEHAKVKAGDCDEDGVVTAEELQKVIYLRDMLKPLASGGQGMEVKSSAYLLNLATCFAANGTLDDSAHTSPTLEVSDSDVIAASLCYTDAGLCDTIAQ
jgi:hypothetical protein